MTRTPQQIGRSSRRKGGQFERTVAKAFSAAMPGANIKRSIGQSRFGSEAPDVSTPVLWLECKHGIQPSPRAALAQAQEAAPKGRLPVAVVKDNRKPAFVCMALVDFLELVAEWWERAER